MLSHWTWDCFSIASISHYGLCRDKSYAFPISLEVCKGRTGASSIRLGSYPQDPTIRMGSLIQCRLHVSFIRPEVPGI